MNDKQILLSNLIASHCENVFFSPSYWDSLSDNTQELFLSTFSKSVDEQTTKVIQDQDLNIFK